MAEVKGVIHEQHYITYLSAGNNLLTADEPVAEGGTGAGFTPSELLCSALASCTCITLRMYADRKLFLLEKVETDVSLVRDAVTNTTAMQRTITLTGALNEEQKARLQEIANSCPIHKILSGQINIKTSLV